MKISQRVFELLPGHEMMDGQMDRQMDTQGDYYRAPLTSSGGTLMTNGLVQHITVGESTRIPNCT